MKQVVYIDILLSVNLMIDYCLVRAAARLAGRVCSRVRICLASIVGAACSLVVLLPPQTVWVKVLITVFSAGMMTLAATGAVNVGAFIKMCSCLILVTLCYGGIMSCIWLFIAPRGLIVNNGAVYADIDPVTLIVCAAVFYSVSALYSRTVRKRTFERSACRIRITRNGMSKVIDGIFDTGNLLCEPFSGLPVIIAERRYIEELIPATLDGFARGECSYPLPEGIRVVPYSSVGGSGLLAAFRPDSIRVYSAEGERAANAYVGVSEDSLGQDCHAVISPDALE